MVGEASTAASLVQHFSKLFVILPAVLKLQHVLWCWWSYWKMQRKCVLPALTGTKGSWGAEQCREQKQSIVWASLLLLGKGPWEAVISGWEVVACLSDFWQFRLPYFALPALPVAAPVLICPLVLPQQSAGCVPLFCHHEPSATCSSFSPMHSVHWINVP